jgi:hypothetical protein
MARTIPDPARRRFLVGGGVALLGGPALLAACTDSSTTTTDAGATNGTDDTDHEHGNLGEAGDGSGPVLFAIVDPNNYATAGTEQRLPLAMGDPDGATDPDPPAELTFQVAKEDTPFGDPITVARHGEGIPIPYFPLRFTPDEPGTYSVTVVDGAPTQKQVFSVRDSRASNLVGPGQPLPATVTPTPADSRGVEPICTRLPQPCDLHEPTLAAALAQGRPIALQVGTPMFCHIGVCGPVLDLMLAKVPDHPGITFLHAEVYDDAEAVGVQAATPAQIVTDLGLTFEPSLYVAGTDGVVVERLDFIFDRTEINQALAAIS